MTTSGNVTEATQTADSGMPAYVEPPLPVFTTLSILIPVYNEERYLTAVVKRVIEQPVPGGLKREIILVNDASKDRTWDIMQRIPEHLAREGVNYKMLNKPVNEGKGAALRDAWKMATGDLLIIQDADFEYDPADYPKLLQPILDGKADVVFGSRFIGEPHRVMYFWHQVANNMLTMLSNMLTNLNLTDMEVCYKVFTRSVYEQISIKSPRFGVEPELTAKVARLRVNGKKARVYEVGVAYAGRTYEEGKKIGWKDAISAITQILRFRFED
ncbi:MAG TPA: glycosyltransferase family 2 protein [Phycisphaerae bacterium]|nr:glycosyltransferase family 2 protein [Phycisphaerae bacterium]